MGRSATTLMWARQLDIIRAWHFTGLSLDERGGYCVLNKYKTEFVGTQERGVASQNAGGPGLSTRSSLLETMLRKGKSLTPAKPEKV